MSQIYISDKALDQYLRYAGNNASAKKLLKGFKKGRKPSIYNDKKSIRARGHQTNATISPVSRRKIKTFLRRAKKSLKTPKVQKASVSNKPFKTPKVQKTCAPNKSLNNTNSRKKKRTSRVVPAQPIVFAYAPQLSKRTTKNFTKPRKKERALIETKSNDMYNFAGEYNARNVEFGHGRRKSLEWNQASAAELRKDLENLHKLHRSDPNLFDREAIK